MLWLLTGAIDGGVTNATTFMASSAWTTIQFFIGIVILGAILWMVYGIISRKKV